MDTPNIILKDHYLRLFYKDFEKNKDEKEENKDEKEKNKDEKEEYSQEFFIGLKNRKNTFWDNHSLNKRRNRNKVPMN